ncbi:non-ribosomal peptide synthetase [Pseudoalteromonas sp. MMG012]|uniref:non-ribosomal peptide synthetase n=1 Tax=Pseudoalteromonas sp. MMG012 TaxID=2822686 RepID=UPI001B39D54B|nr:non-ribosomal peptide synthetase [Pseudoalteromonas sp. MMG012]MBQ4852872.1 amino acid adenylation domain-containing protein [Pseudoalteromonas sp. MMG012]
MTFEGPRNTSEQNLLKIWQRLLANDDIGVHDHFFTVGGDSILAIQLVAKARECGLHLTLKQIMEAPSVAEQALLAQSHTQISAEQAPLTGEFTLLPIQKRFLQQSIEPALHHYNQSIMLNVPLELSKMFLQGAMYCLLNRHDALRLRFIANNDDWHGQFMAIEQLQLTRCVEVVTLESWSKAAVTDISAHAQTNFDISAGHLFKATLITSDTEARLLLVAHHLVIDGVSWRVIVQDLQRLWRQQQNNARLQLPQKTSSIQQWSSKLIAHSDNFLAKEGTFWQQQMALGSELLPFSKRNMQPSLRTQSKTLGLTLSDEVTGKLIGSANKAYHTGVDDLLLSGLAIALYETFAIERIAVALESHGRVPIFPELDLSETVGWFTSMYPLLLNVEKSDIAGTIISTKERRRSIRDHGIGFGVIENLKNANDLGLLQQFEPQILFNYLGQIEASAAHAQDGFSLADEHMGSNLHAETLRDFAIAINGQVSDGNLRFVIDYSDEQFHSETMLRFKECFIRALQSIADHCEGCIPKLTTSDVPFVAFKQPQLDKWQHRFGILSGVYPATPLQHGIYFQSQMDEQAYLTQVVTEIRGDLDVQRMSYAWQQVTQRYDMLRSCFAIEQNGLYRFVLANPVEMPIRYLDWRELNAEQQCSALQKIRQEDREQAMALNSAPLHRVTIVRYQLQRYALMWTHHHIILDGWCIPIVYRELLRTYFGDTNNHKEPLPAPVSLDGYYDWLQRKDRQSALNYWREYLSDFNGPTSLLNQQTSSEEKGYTELSWQLDEHTSQQLSLLANEAKVTLNSVIQWVWGYLLQRYSGNQKVLFGTVISGRPAEVNNIEKMVGLFINTIPVKVDFTGDLSLLSQLKRLHDNQLNGQENGFLTLPEIQQETAIPAGVDMFDSLVVFENYPSDIATERSKSDAEIVIENSESAESSAVPLTLIVSNGHNVHLTLGYRREFFQASEAEQLKHHIDAIFSQVAKRKELGNINLITHDEAALLAKQHDTQYAYDLSLLPHQYVAKFAQSRPQSPAIFDGEQVLTYRELDEAANRLARLLQEQGVTVESFVALYLERHSSMAIAILAVFKAGGAYVPIDPSMPDDRNIGVLDQLGDVCVLTQNHLKDHTCLRTRQIIVLDTEQSQEKLGQYPCTTFELQGLSQKNLAYMIFTSGTTGKPKGVMVEHQALLNRVLWMQKQYGMTKHDKVLQKTPYSFDVSVWEFIWPWLVGASIVMARPGGHKEPKYLAALIQDKGVTHCHFVPSMLQAFLQHSNVSDCKSLHQVFCSGEALLFNHREQFRQVSTAQLHNLYGPTEAAIDVSYWDCRKDNSQTHSIPIGYAIDNINCVVVSADMVEQPIGIPGELLIAGAGLARGYFQQAQLTQDKFIEANIYNRPQQRYYRTGDLVRRLACGAIEFLGRLDHQVKIRGLRVELGEIQSAIEACDGIEQAFVSLQIRNSREHLVAFCASAMDTKVLSESLREQLLLSLPDYMVPSVFIALDVLPVTANGKLDRNALMEMEISAPKAEYIEAQTITEIALEEIWRQCLGNSESLSITQTFFALGGNSLHAMSILDRIQIHWNYPFEIADLFAFQTIKELAQFIDATQSQPISEQHNADSETFEEMEF